MGDAVSEDGDRKAIIPGGAPAEQMSASPITAPAQDPIAAQTASGEAPRSREHGGPEGPEPTRFGDWEKAGRCIDF
ncbi:hypothetical protein ACG33_09440 [Steroidobacter denitrificans]|uniref:DUF1674 domain-containing protein n=1 Tax=Steroidobacter denitrificans TaxID=465721 RepID=A0A127FA67_STEDE|nr:hypothetical protein ACG33_09440 [Steroidobacter denitrificans]